jgi:hypothetical protein
MNRISFLHSYNGSSKGIILLAAISLFHFSRCSFLVVRSFNCGVGVTYDIHYITWPNALEARYYVETNYAECNFNRCVTASSKKAGEIMR